jgi:putative oxidoreductase
MTAPDVALLLLRVVVGGIYLAHGARKLGAWSDSGFGAFRASIARRGYRPATAWAAAAVGAEIGGGILAILGLLTPVGAALLLAQSVTIVGLVRSRGFWVEVMGVEYPLLLATGALAVGLLGAGGLSVDAALGLAWDPWVAIGAAAVAVLGALAGMALRRPPPDPAEAPR